MSDVANSHFTVNGEYMSAGRQQNHLKMYVIQMITDSLTEKINARISR